MARFVDKFQETEPVVAVRTRTAGPWSGQASDRGATVVLIAERVDGQTLELGYVTDLGFLSLFYLDPNEADKFGISTDASGYWQVEY